MAKIAIKKRASPIRKDKLKLWNVFVNTLAILVFAVAFGWMALSIYSQEKEGFEADEQYKAALPKPGEAVRHDLVCMVNNMYMGSAQIAVPINGKIYYGCCAKCVQDLNADESTRYAVDPLSKKRVDKAKAYILISPDMTGAVIYFESEKNVKEYLNK